MKYTKTIERLFYFLFAVCVGIWIGIYERPNRVALSPPQKTTNTRYFFVAYDYPNGSGCIMFLNTQFPNNNSTRKDISKSCGKDWNDIVITYIYEFKNETDFNNFTK